VEQANVGDPEIQTRKLTRLEYERMVDAEILGPEDRVELLGGTIVLKEPQYSPHATAIQLAARALRRAFAEGWDVRVQLPLALADDSEPEPDVWVVPGDPRDYHDRHPETAALVVEVALSRVAFDRGYKASLYASGGIADYWIVDLRARRLEMQREPVPDPSAPFGSRYGRTVALGTDQRIAPLAMPSAEIAVADLLP
jgi:Uma2 family endonuclease